MDGTLVELSSAVAAGAREQGRAGLTAEAATPQKPSGVTSQAGGRGAGSGSRWRRWFSGRKQDEKRKLRSESVIKTEPRPETKSISQPNSESGPAPKSDVGPNATLYPPSAQVPVSNSFSNPITQPTSHNSS